MSHSSRLSPPPITESGDVRGPKSPSPPPPPRRRRRCCIICSISTAVLVLVLLVVGLSLAFTVFKSREPETTLVSTTVYGVSPSLTFPTAQFQLNVSLALRFLVQNPNYASFRHAPGKSFLYYRGQPVGDADVAPGTVPARGSETVDVQASIETASFATDIGPLINDALAGALGVDAATTIPGRISILGIIKHNAVATSQCHLVIGFPEMVLRSRECKRHLDV